MAKKFFLMCAGMLCLASIVHAQVAAGTVLGEDAAGYPHAFIVMDNGDVYRSDYVGPKTTAPWPQGPWSRGCNIFTAGGPTSRVVGLGGGTVLTAAGGTYRLGTGAGVSCDAIFDGVINHPAGQSFIAIGSNESINGCNLYAVTDAGTVYRAWTGCGPSGWEYAGSLPTGPTPTSAESWGQLKARYRSSRVSISRPQPG
jgi:hypothetical protein